MVTSYGSLAQLVRAAPLHGVGRRFEPVRTHHQTFGDVMEIRMHRGSLAASLATKEKIEGTRASVVEYLNKYIGVKDSEVDSINVEPYGDSPDTRVGWEKVFLVKTGGMALAFCDSPLVDGPPPTTKYLLAAYSQSTEVVLVRADGTVRWNGREVETDADFREAMKAFFSTYTEACAIGNSLWPPLLRAALPEGIDASIVPDTPDVTKFREFFKKLKESA